MGKIMYSVYGYVCNMGIRSVFTLDRFAKFYMSIYFIWV